MSALFKSFEYGTAKKATSTSDQNFHFLSTRRVCCRPCSKIAQCDLSFFHTHYYCLIAIIRSPRGQLYDSHHTIISRLGSKSLALRGSKSGSDSESLKTAAASGLARSRLLALFLVTVSP